ncbi:hypothetical protein BGZ76_006229, partial [Entomortierella beljakovae]
ISSFPTFDLTHHKMIKATIFAFLLVQLCILQAHASHYIQFKLRRITFVGHNVAICMHDGERIIMKDSDTFGSGVNNYGFHKDGYSATVSWKTKEVEVANWQAWYSKFPTVYDNGYLAKWEGCWSTTSLNCNSFHREAKRQCDRALIRV